MKIAPGIHRIGGNSMINAYLVEEAGEVTIIDAGLSGYYGDIDRELAAMGRAPADVRALVLTHGHSDHLGFAERLRRERAVPVSVHEADAALARVREALKRGPDALAAIGGQPDDHPGRGAARSGEVSNRGGNAGPPANVPAPGGTSQPRKPSTPNAPANPGNGRGR